MRLDRFLTATNTLTRSEASKACRSGRIEVNGRVEKSSAAHIDENNDEIRFDGELIVYKEFLYIMLNKPCGFISATDDPKQKTVLELLPEKLHSAGLFPCGRLDIDTEGLLILTNDGQTAHRLISPKHHAEKIYRFECEKPLFEDDISRLEGGIELDDGYITLPCRAKSIDDSHGELVLTEGKFHQVKRMLEAVSNRVLYLERISFAGIALDSSLERGQWRYLTDSEEKLLTKIN